jgi:Cellulase (glycosyl hydrolase family 5)
MRRRTAVWAAVLACGLGAAVPGLGPEAVASVHRASPAVVTRVPVAQLRIMNYYPADAGWTEMWSNYSHTRTASDFQAIRALGANTVRIIVQPSAVGYPTVTSTGLAEFRDVLATAREAGLGVQLTLFDWWSSYGDVAGSEQWLRSLLGGQAGNPTIALVELQNELPVTSDSAIGWAQTLLPFVKTVLPGVPRTVSASGSSGLSGITTLLKRLTPSMTDVADVHYYGDASGAAAAIRTARASAGGRPVIVGEAGLSTTDGAAGEEAQARFYRVLARTTTALGIPPAAPWTYSDFTSSAIPGHPAAVEYHFGLRRLDGSWKPAAAVVAAAFANRVDNNWDGGFEREVNNNGARLGSWTPFDAADGLGVVSTDPVRSGRKSVCFAATSSRVGAVPSVYQKFPVLRSGELFTASVYVDRIAPTGGERIAIAWFDATGHYLGQVESLYANTAGVWQQLKVSAPAPPAAATVEIHLKAAHEAGRACYDDASITW